MGSTCRRTLFAAALALLLMAPLGAAAQAVGIQRLTWLQGCWQIDTPERVVEEQWTAPRAHSMLGSSRTVRGDKLVAHEFVLLRERGEQLAYEVQPSGQPATAFLAVKLGESSVVFENLQHDFPQRVAYERKGNELLAWIEGPRPGQAGQMRRIEYPYRRVACAGD
ncbi:MAG: DUF6265 family protein [Burkholderiaceae bacterium]